jgi:hypothetical protein
MLLEIPDALLIAALSIALFVALCAALVLVTVSLNRPSNVPLMVAAGLVVFCVMIVAVAPLNVPLLVGMLIALLGSTLGVLGGNPITRRVLDIATGGEVREGVRGGIMVYDSRSAGADRMQEVLRGGTVIGYLERLAVVASLVAGYPEAIAVVVAIKGIGRFSELATPAARERFIVGTLASLLWAGLVGALVRLAIW